MERALPGAVEYAPKPAPGRSFNSVTLRSYRAIGENGCDHFVTTTEKNIEKIGPPG